MGIVVCCRRWGKTDLCGSLSIAANRGSRALGDRFYCRYLEKLGTQGLSSIASIGGQDGMWGSMCIATGRESRDCCLLPLSGEVGPAGIVVCCCRRGKIDSWGSLSVATATGGSRDLGDLHLSPPPGEANLEGSLSVTTIWGSWARGDHCLLSLLREVGTMGIVIYCRHQREAAIIFIIAAGKSWACGGIIVYCRSRFPVYNAYTIITVYATNAYISNLVKYISNVNIDSK